MTKFSDTGLSPEVLQGVEALGFTELTPIQEKTIPFLLNSDKDIIGLAQTGTGKTAAFGLPLVDLIDPAEKGVQGLVLCPTRELCIQIAKDLEDYSKYLEKVNIVAVYGGSDIRTQIRGLRKGAQIVVGTPGRVLDLIKRMDLVLSEVNYLVLDEADEMLNMGFQEDLEAIIDETPAERQTLLFSATMPPRIGELASKYLRNPQEISIGSRNSGAKNVSHEYFVISPKNRYLALKRLVDFNPGIYGIIFCRTRAETREISESLIADGYNAEAIHGELSQSQRDNVMARFRSQSLQLLIATDVAARGVDVDDLTHVINFNLPDDPEVYIHRSGRTGRAGKSGISLSLITPKEEYRIKRLEKISGKAFKRLPVPDGKSIVEKQLVLLIDKITDSRVDEEKIGPFMPLILDKWKDMDREELIKKFLSIEFNRFLSYYNGAPDLNSSEKEKPARTKTREREDDRRRGNSQFTGFYLNVGAKSKITPRRLIGMINELTGDPGLQIGKIQIDKKISYFEVQTDAVDQVLSAFDFATFQGDRLIAQLAPEAPKRVFSRSEAPRKKHRKGAKSRG
ncbi:MAG: DEAD/DEAH box helicase [Bacteroidia bacterium]|nr:DEAD/DEAH box helicase [Bacteroidia bacterium]